MSDLTAKRIRIIRADGPGSLSFAEWHDLCELALRGYVGPSAVAEGGPWQWVSMKERQPADFETVLCVNSNNWMAVANRFHKAFGDTWNASHVSAEDTDDELVIGDITHWTPLPSGPASDK